MHNVDLHNVHCKHPFSGIVQAAQNFKVGYFRPIGGTILSSNSQQELAWT